MSQAEDHEDSAYEVMPPALEEFQMKVNPIYGKVSGIVATKKEQIAEDFQQKTAYYSIKKIMVTLVVTVVLMAVLILAVAAACIAFALEISNLKTEMASTQQKYIFNSTHNTASEFATQHLMDQQRLLYEALKSSLEDSLSQLQINGTRDMEQNLAHLMDQQRMLNEALQFSLEDRLSQLRSNVTRDMELDFARWENSTLQIINMAWEVFEKNLTGLNTELQIIKSELPVSSCAAVPPSSPSGYYLIRASNGSAVRAYCDMTRSCGGVTGGWMRVAELNMTNSSHQCPSGLMERTHVRAGQTDLRTCVSTKTDGASCSDGTFFDTIIPSYTKVCGKIIGYQIGGTNGFDGLVDIESYYVDGVSLTHGSQSSRQHIWTFAAARDLFSGSKCPGTRAPPNFVGADYFCDTGATTEGSVSNTRFFADRPLWDCANNITSCDSSGSPPWFYKELSGSTTDNIEMRVCRNEIAGHEDVAIETVEIYVQ